MNIPTRKTLGIIGGMGALAGAKFFQTIIEHTDAKKDSDHIDIILTSFSQIPDRTSDKLYKKSSRLFVILRSKNHGNAL